MKNIHFPFAVLVALALTIASSQAQIAVGDATPTVAGEQIDRQRDDLSRKPSSGLRVQVSAQMRETDPTVMDVSYTVNSQSTPTVNVRVLAFEDGARGFATVVRPETFIEGTDANIGDEIAANIKHRLSWKVSSDWATDLAKVKFEVLAMSPGEWLLPGMHFVTIPATEGHLKTIVSVNDENDFVSNVGGSGDKYYSKWWNGAFLIKGHTPLLNALLWLYAGGDNELSLANGSLWANGQELVRHAGFVKEWNSYWSCADKAFAFVFQKMGFRLLKGDELAWVNENTRLNLRPGSYYDQGWPSNGFGQFAVKTLEE